MKAPRAAATVPKPRSTPGKIVRTSARLRRAIVLIATQALTVKDAAEQVGMNTSALSRAINRPHHREMLEQAKALTAQEAESLRGIARTIAIKTGLKLMTDSKSDSVRARMVELFTAEPKTQTPVNVAINIDRGGYEYVRPGAHVVDIRPPADNQSGVIDAQAIDNIEE